MFTPNIVEEVQSLSNPRKEIEEAITAQDLPLLLRMTGMLHGHFCPFEALGVKAAARAMRDLGVKPTGMEEVVAIVETNNCFSDGVQFVTGCSLGNNALIYRDYGKTAFTLAKRTGEGLRLSAKVDTRFLARQAPEAFELFSRVVINHQGTSEDQARLSDLWEKFSFEMLDMPDEELFRIRPATVVVPAYAKIFASATCSICGEDVLEPRARIKEGELVCIPCSREAYYQLAGDGISVVSASS